uniref:Uncharacterized protein n=1 Tax=Peronospora matthiolae TaxID=2874970 RepID=A0AAV1UHR6_9STRA
MRHVNTHVAAASAPSTAVRPAAMATVRSVTMMSVGISINDDCPNQSDERESETIMTRMSLQATRRNGDCTQDVILA